MNKVYVAGHCLTRGSQMQRTVEKEELAHANPRVEFYVPQENKEINDKANAVQEGLAERIVKADTAAINWSDTVVIEPLAEACGTMVELGQIKGMKDVSSQVLQIIESEELTDEDKLRLIQEATMRHYKRRVFPHFEDIRRVPGITEEGDRRSLGINAYVYGVCLDLTNGKGFYDWEEIMKRFGQEA